MTAVDWEAYRKCPVCPAGLGKPCVQTSVFTVAGGVAAVEADAPHSPRERRAG